MAVTQSTPLQLEPPDPAWLQIQTIPKDDYDNNNNNNNDNDNHDGNINNDKNHKSLLDQCDTSLEL